MLPIHFLSKCGLPMLRTSAGYSASISDLDSKLDSKAGVKLQVVEKKERE